MLKDGQGTKRRRNIAENFNRLSRVHERHRRQTDGRATAYSKRECEFTFAKKVKPNPNPNINPNRNPITLLTIILTPLTLLTLLNRNNPSRNTTRAQQ